MSIRHVLVAFLLLSLLASPAQAQVLGRDRNGIYPLRSFSLRLVAGRRYEFETRNLVRGGTAVADTVLSLRPLEAPAGVHAIAGADGCGAEFERSCFVTAPIASSGDYALLLRAWTTPTYGTAEVRYREVGAAWRSLGTVAFGGATVAHSIAPGSGPVRFETVHAPGQILFHTLWVVPPGGMDWEIDYVELASSERTYGAAAIDVPDPTAAGLATGRPGFYTFGTIQLGYVGDSALVFNERDPALDYDRDGLSQALERSLGTCDRPTDFAGAGLPCTSVGTIGESANICGGFPSFPSDEARDDCAAALRDTDNDGLADDLETFGFGALRLPQWGATPIHADLFIEMDALDQDVGLETDRPTVCDGFAPEGATALGIPGAIDQIGEAEADFDAETIAPNFFGLLAQQFSGYPAGFNPTNTPGIRLHYDVGIASPDPRDTRYGAWGGGGTCIPYYDAEPRDDRIRTTFCNYQSVYHGDRIACPSLPTSSVAAARDRRWAFIWALDGLGDSGGQTPHAGTYYAANATEAHIHELGHVLNLGHPGPMVSYLGQATNEAGLGFLSEEGNVRPNYPSRINYLYEAHGGADGGDTSGNINPVFTSLSFSYGGLGLFSAHAMEEIAPWGRVSRGLDFFTVPYFGGTYPEYVARVRLTTAGHDVDWNRDGAYGGIHEVASPVSLAQARMIDRRRLLERRASPTGTIDLAPNGAAVVNGVLLLATRTCTSSSCTIELRGDGDDDDCNRRPFGGPRATDPLGPGAYPGCFGHGATREVTPVGRRVRSVAITRVSSGTRLVIAARVEHPRTPAIHEILVTDVGIVPVDNPTEFLITAPRYSASVVSIVRGASEAVGLAPYSDTEVMLAFQHTSGDAYILTTDPRTGTSTVARRARTTTGGRITMTGSPSLAAAGGRIFMAAPLDSTVALFELVRSTGQWAARARLRPNAAPMERVTDPLVTIVDSWEGTRVRVDFINPSSGYAHPWRSGPLNSLSPFPPLIPIYANALDMQQFQQLSGIFDDRMPLSDTADLRLYARQAYDMGVELWLRPFASLGDAAILPDYLDWLAIEHGMCFNRSIAAVDAPSTTLGGLIPTPYDRGRPTAVDPGRCGPLPRFAEAPTLPETSAADAGEPGRTARSAAEAADEHGTVMRPPYTEEERESVLRTLLEADRCVR